MTNNSCLVPGIVRPAWGGTLDVEIQVMGYPSAATSGSDLVDFIKESVTSRCWVRFAIQGKNTAVLTFGADIKCGVATE